MPSAPPPCWSTSTRLPSTTVVPLRLFANGSPCATCFAYSGAASAATTMSTNRASAESAIRLRARRRPARRQGLFPATSRVLSPGARTTPPAGSGSYANSARRRGRRALCNRGLVEQQEPLRAEREVLEPLRHEVELLGVEHGHPGRGVRDLLVPLLPDRIALGRVLDRRRGRVRHLALDRLVAELRDVRARVRVRMERVAPEQDIEEVRRGRVVREPARVREVHLVLRVLDIRILDVVGQELRRGLVAELVEQVDEVLAVGLVHLGRVGVHLTRRAGGAGLLHELLCLRHVRRGPLAAPRV